MDSHSLTNIERKVLSRALKPRHNDISHKEEDPTFNLSIKIPQPSATLNPSESSRGFSVSQSFQQIFLNTRDFDFSGISTDLDEDLAQRLKDLIGSSPPQTRISLPGRKLCIADLRFRVPQTVIGTAGTLIEVQTGPIEIDFTGTGEPGAVTLCEMEVFFAAKSHRSKSALFRLRAQGANLELRDCFLTSDAYRKHTTAEDCADGPYSTCIDCEGSVGAGVSIRSCNVKSFTEVISGGSKTSIDIEKCHLEECQGDFVSVENVRRLVIEESTVERGHGCGVNVRFVQSRRGTSGSFPRGPIPLTSDSTCEIRIEASEIRALDLIGVQLSSEHAYPLSLSLVLSHNKVSHCKGEAVSMKHITLENLQINSNDLNCNQGSGIWLQKLRGATSESQLSVAFNRCFDSYSGYGMYLYDAAVMLDNNECFRNNCKGYVVGGLLVSGTTGAAELVIRRCTFHTNGENGVEVRDYGGAVIIESCLVFENFHNGLYVTRALRESTRTTEPSGVLSLNRSQISRNRRYGLSLSKVPCELLETVIAENSRGAIEVDEESKSLIKFSEATPTRLRELVKGDIGGEWGQLYPEKKPLCDNIECMLL